MIKHEKLLLSLTLMGIIATACTGCSNMKFVEKVSESTEELGEINDSEDLGDITEVEIEEPVSEETTTVVDNPNITVVNGITFKKCEEKTVYLKEDASIIKSPDEKSTVVETLLKGDTLTILSKSEDGVWAIVRHYDGPICYIRLSHITYSIVKPDIPELTESQSSENTSQSESKTESVAPEPTQSTQPSTSKPESHKTESTKPESTKPSTTQQASSSQKTESVAPSTTTVVVPPEPSESEEVDPGYLTSGIPYPANPSGTSINLGVTFANVDMILTVTYDKTTANSGPGKATTSTGYEVRATFMKGNTVACTGIGDNGYCRVELANGIIAFIDGTHLQE